MQDYEELSEDFIAPYGGGSENGPKIWKEMIGTGNNWLRDDFPFLHGHVPQPSSEDKDEWFGKFKPNEREITIKDLEEIKDFREEKEPSNRDKISWLEKYIIYHIYDIWHRSETTQTNKAHLIALWDDLIVKNRDGIRFT